MITWLFFLAAFFLTIMVVVGFHEAAHCIAAKLMGVKVLRFSIGFGKSLFSIRDKSGTEYCFALIPLGGYVKMLGESDEALKEVDLKHSYAALPFYKKAFVIAAGPLANFIIAFLLYVAVYSIGFTTVKPIMGEITSQSIAAQAGFKPFTEIVEVGNVATPNWTKVVFQLVLHAGQNNYLQIKTRKVCGLTETPLDHCRSEIISHWLPLTNFKLSSLKPDPLESLGVTPYFPAVPLMVGQVVANSPAAIAGFAVNDQLLKLNQHPITSWDHLASDIRKQLNKPLQFEILRDNKPLILSVTLPVSPSEFKKNPPRIGLAPPSVTLPPVMLQTIKYKPVQAMYHAFQQCKELTYFNLAMLQKMLIGELSLDSLGGPITIFDTAGEALNQGSLAFVVFLAFMNLSIGLINLFPIPGLDGGHLLLQGIEALIRRPIPPQMLEWSLRIGFILLFLIFFRALFNDIMRLF